MRTLKNTKTLILVLGVLFALLALAACGSNGDFDSDDSGAASVRDQSTGNFDGESADAPASPGTAEESEGRAGGATFASGDDAGGIGTDIASGVRKIIFTSNVSLEVENVTGSFQTISHIAAASGGFVESSDLSRKTGSDDEIHEFSSITIRVPSTQYDDVLDQLRGLPGGTQSHMRTRSQPRSRKSTLTSRVASEI